ncbi:MAG: PilN domain-containing protein [Gaiellaceae bacterium]
MRAVNLLPRDVERSRGGGSRLLVLLVAGGAAAVTAGIVVAFLSASGAAGDRHAELAALEEAIARVPNAGLPAVTSANLVQERTDRVAALAAALSTRTPFDRLFRELSFVLPADAWLTGITAAAPASTPPTGASQGGTPPASTTTTQGVTIQGATYSHRSVARVLARLSVIPSLENVRLTASARVEPQADETNGVKTKTKKQKPVVTFTVSASIRTGSTS